MAFELKIKLSDLAPLADLQVLTVIRTHRNRFVKDIGYVHEQGVPLLKQIVQLRAGFLYFLAQLLHFNDLF